MKKDRYTYNFIIFKNGKKVTKLERIGMLSRFFWSIVMSQNHARLLRWHLSNYLCINTDKIQAS